MTRTPMFPVFSPTNDPIKLFRWLTYIGYIFLYCSHSCSAVARCSCCAIKPLKKFRLLLFSKQSMTQHSSIAGQGNRILTEPTVAVNGGVSCNQKLLKNIQIKKSLQRFDRQELCAHSETVKFITTIKANTLFV